MTFTSLLQTILESGFSKAHAEIADLLLKNRDNFEIPVVNKVIAVIHHLVQHFTRGHRYRQR